MTPVFRFPRALVAFVLAVLWLPATLHCDLDAIQLFAAHVDSCCSTACDAHPAAADDAPCTTGSCAVVEEGAYRPCHDNLGVAAPELIVVANLAEIWTALAVEQRAELVVRPAESPPAHGRPWQFVRRAAQSPRAPSQPV